MHLKYPGYKKMNSKYNLILISVIQINHLILKIFCVLQNSQVNLCLS